MYNFLSILLIKITIVIYTKKEKITILMGICGDEEHNSTTCQGRGKYLRSAPLTSLLMSDMGLLTFLEYSYARFFMYFEF